MDLFLFKAFEPETRFLFFAVVVVVTSNVVLHELAHGWMALRLGDRTPLELGHMTGNPLVHMGPWSLGALLVIGIAWGAMPVNPSRMRGRHAEAWVSGAGPMMNLLIALVTLTALGIWTSVAGLADHGFEQNLQRFLWIFGYFNLVLMVFNLAPIPPLDGSGILANLSPRYRHWMWDHEHLTPAMFIGYFILIGALEQTPFGLFGNAAGIAQAYLDLFP